jgi:hypothetical protein
MGVTPHRQEAMHCVIWRNILAVNELPLKTKETYASLIIPGSCQRHLDWRRFGLLLLIVIVVLILR